MVRREEEYVEPEAARQALRAAPPLERVRVPSSVSAGAPGSRPQVMIGASLQAHGSCKLAERVTLTPERGVESQEAARVAATEQARRPQHQGNLQSRQIHNSDRAAHVTVKATTDHRRGRQRAGRDRGSEGLTLASVARSKSPMSTASGTATFTKRSARC
jgi:hypothetical protein